MPRYVWNVYKSTYNVDVVEKTDRGYDASFVTNASPANRPVCAASAEIDNTTGSFVLTDTQTLTNTSAYTIRESATARPYFAVVHPPNTTKTDQIYYSTRVPPEDGYWNVYKSSYTTVNMVTKRTGTVSTADMYLLSTQYLKKTLAQGEYQNQVSSSSSTTYPKHTASNPPSANANWYSYLGSDDPAIQYVYFSSTAKRGQPVTVSITPGNTNLAPVYYKWAVYYTYQTDTGTSTTSTQTIISKTSNTSITYTLSANETNASVTFKVQPFDSIGWTGNWMSTTASLGEVILPKSMYIGVNDVASQLDEFYVGVDDIAREIEHLYVGVDNKARKIF